VSRRSVVVVAEPDRCLGSGQCTLLAPDVFGQNPVNGTVRLLADRAAGDRLADVSEAVARCPVGALALADGGQQ
jgi:ferredoxin